MDQHRSWAAARLHQPPASQHRSASSLMIVSLVAQHGRLSDIVGSARPCGTIPGAASSLGRTTNNQRAAAHAPPPTRSLRPTTMHKQTTTTFASTSLARSSKLRTTPEEENGADCQRAYVHTAGFFHHLLTRTTTGRPHTS